MFTVKLLACLYLVLMHGLSVAADTPAGPSAPPGDSIGRVLISAEVEALNTHIFPDGAQLPDGQGTADAGQVLYEENCASCHGWRGEGANAVELVGDRSLLDTEYPDKGIGVYWPYAPTLFEYMQRAMPPDNPGLFSNEEIYSIVGYLLVLNDLLAVDGVVNREILSSIVMPNRDGFSEVYPSTQ